MTLPQDFIGRIIFIINNYGLSLLKGAGTTLAIALVGTIIGCIIGFVVGTCKMPQIDSIKISRETAGENLDDVIKRAIKFKLKKNRIYVYSK